MINSKLAFYGDSNLDYFKAEDSMCNTVFRTAGTRPNEAHDLRCAIVCVNNHDLLTTALEELLAEVDAYLGDNDAEDSYMQQRADIARGVLGITRKQMLEAEHD